jgi:hypothetical protein
MPKIVASLTIVIYDCNMFLVQATVLIEYYWTKVVDKMTRFIQVRLSRIFKRNGVTFSVSRRLSKSMESLDEILRTLDEFESQVRIEKNASLPAKARSKKTVWWTFAVADPCRGGPLPRQTFAEVDICQGGPLPRQTFAEADICRGGPLPRRTFAEADLG